MMDASPMYPRSFHPTAQDWLPHDITTYAPHCSRSSAPVPIKYYFIDFGYSSRFAPDETNRLVVGSKGLDGEVPELSDDVPYDPFRLDVFVVGNMFRQTFLSVSTPQFLTIIVGVCLHQIDCPEVHEFGDDGSPCELHAAERSCYAPVCCRGVGGLA